MYGLNPASGALRNTMASQPAAESEYSRIPKPPSGPVESALADLTNQQEQMFKQVSALFERLSPVLATPDASPTSEPERRPQMDKPISVVTHTPLLRRIHDLYERNQSLIGQLDMLYQAAIL